MKHTFENVHIQGSLDSLCGIYCLINSMSMLLKDVDSDELFSAIVHRIGERDLPGILLEGLSPCQFERIILPACIRHCRRHGTVQYKTIPNRIAFDTYWTRLKQHTERYGVGSVVLSLWGMYNHWTCVRRVTDHSLLLVDSCAKDVNVNRLSRQSISIHKRVKRRHQLVPEWTYLLSVG